MSSLKNDSHASLAQSSLKLITRIEDRFANQRWGGGIAVLRTVVDFIGETAPTGWTFFHLVARYQAERRQEGIRNYKLLTGGSRSLILTAATDASNQQKALQQGFEGGKAYHYRIS
jgi:hypothetical protein